MRQYHVYIMASRSRTLYIGVTNDLWRRVQEHRTGANTGFTSRYRVHRLVWCEEFDDVNDAIAAEKAMKKWNRAKKLDLIQEANPSWKDLSNGWYGEEDPRALR